MTYVLGWPNFLQAVCEPAYTVFFMHTMHNLTNKIFTYDLGWLYSLKSSSWPNLDTVIYTHNSQAHKNLTYDLWPQLTLFLWNSWWPVELVGPRTPSPRWGTSCPPPARGGRKTVRGGWSRRNWGTGKVLGRGSLDRLKTKTQATVEEWLRTWWEICLYITCIE